MSSKIPVHPSIIDAELEPRLLRLGDHLVAAAFFLMKLVPAEYILRRAAEEGLLAPGGVVVESSSGSFGHALALVCRLRGYRFVMVSDPVVDPRLQTRLEELGASVEIVREPAAVGGYQVARLERLHQIMEQHPGSYWPRQYDNPWHPEAYGAIAARLVESIGAFDCLVGTVGSGGSMCGLATALRAQLPALEAVGVDSHGSILFGEPDRSRALRGLGNSIMPRNLRHDVFDEVHWVTAAEGFRATRELHARHGVFRGPTSGAAWLVADHQARLGKRTVVIFPDEGHRYDADVYSDGWLAAQGHAIEALPAAPLEVARPGEHVARWTRMAWRRRELAEVVKP